MSWENDGSAELDEVVRNIRASDPESIAQKLDRWARDGVKIAWTDFADRAVLERAVQLLRGCANG